MICWDQCLCRPRPSVVLSALVIPCWLRYLCPMCSSAVRPWSVTTYVRYLFSIFCSCLIIPLSCVIADVTVLLYVPGPYVLYRTMYLMRGYDCMFFHSSSVSFIIIRCFIDRFRTLELSILSSSYIVETTFIWYRNTT